MFPYRDENQTQRTPYVTFAIIAINVLVWIVFQRGGQAIALATSVCNYVLIPGELTGMFHPSDPGFPMGDGLVCLAGLGRHQRRHGRLSHSLPARSRLRVAPLGLSLLDGRAARLGHAFVRGGPSSG